MPFRCLLALILLSGACCQSQPAATSAAINPTFGTVARPPIDSVKMNGLTMVAPPQPFSTDPMAPVKAVGANWIAVVPYAFTRPGQPDVRYNYNNSESRWKWWGESLEGVAETIRRAHESGLKTMLKPQVYVPGNWTGTLDFPDDRSWEAWEAGYSKYILTMAQVADSLHVELFCVGTEFNVAINKRTTYWRNLIAQVRTVYQGRLVYSANWDDWDRVPFWADLDYIGLGGYFPLVNAQTPSVDSLRVAWKPIRDRLQRFSEQQNRSVIFTEFGYLSVDGCGWRNWELEVNVRERPINEQAQANCFEALFTTFQPEPWWAGSFLWKWFPNGQGHEGYPERDYTPQGKIGEATLRRFYQR